MFRTFRLIGPVAITITGVVYHVTLAQILDLDGVHAGELWAIELRSVALGPQPVSATLSVTLMVGGNREVNIPLLDGSRRKNSRPLILKAASS